MGMVNGAWCAGYGDDMQRGACFPPAVLSQDRGARWTSGLFKAPAGFVCRLARTTEPRCLQWPLGSRAYVDVSTAFAHPLLPTAALLLPPALRFKVRGLLRVCQ